MAGYKEDSVMRCIKCSRIEVHVHGAQRWENEAVGNWSPLKDNIDNTQGKE